MSDTRYSLVDYCDEIEPHNGTLEGIASWLSKPDKNWHRDSAARPGDTFEASALNFDADIIATRHAGGEWTFSRDPSGYDFLAVRWGEGLGWDPDAIIWGDDMAVALREWLAENSDVGCEFVAAGNDENDLVITFHEGPRCTVDRAALSAVAGR